jgi:DNA repair exonuclease SbcCD ATPase subunit
MTIPDMIESMMGPWIRSGRVQYLKDTGIYEYENVGFGVVSIKDVLRQGNTSGKVDVLPPFPDALSFTTAVEHKVALFHGDLPSKERVNGYHHVLLGDTHKQQIGHYDDTISWGYPGSLIQQDHGEFVFGHGYLLWDLQSNSVSSHHVPNDFGMITLRQLEHGTVQFYCGNRTWIALNEAVQNVDFPKRPFVRAQNMTKDDVDSVSTTYGLQPVKTSFMVSYDEDAETSKQEKESELLTTLCSPNKWKEYIACVAPSLDVGDWLDSPNCMNIQAPAECVNIPKAITTKINERINRISKLVCQHEESVGSLNRKSRNAVVLKNMSWDYTLCFGQDNYFDFESIEGKIALLNGRNASGKSSFLETLCLGLFGEQSRTRFVGGKKMTGKLIHNKKPPNKRAMNIKVVFSVNGIVYEIIREFGLQADKSNISQFGVELYQIKQDTQTKEKIKEGVTAVNAWITENVGTIETVLMSNFITQVDNNNFFLLKQEDQKALLEKALHLESISTICNVIHEARLGHSYVIGQVSAVVESTKQVRGANKVENPLELQIKVRETSDVLVGLHKNKENHLKDAVGFAKDGHSMQECLRQIELYETRLAALPLTDFSEEDTIAKYEQKGARSQIVATLQKELDALVEEIGDMFENDDRQSLEKKYTEYLNIYEEYDKLEKPTKPRYTMDSIHEVKEEYKEWCASHAGVDTDELVSQLENVERELSDMSICAPNTVCEVNEVIGTLPEFRLKKSVYEENLSKMAGLKVVTRTYDEGQHKSWIKKYKSWMKKNQEVSGITLKKLRRKREKLALEYENVVLRETICKLEEELRMYENTPFNPTCWACNKQPWVPIMEEKKARIDEIRKKVNCDDNATVTASSLRDEINDVDNLIRLRLEYEEEYNRWCKEYEKWEVYQNNMKEYDDLAKQTAALQTQLWLYYDNYKKANDCQGIREVIVQYRQWEKVIANITREEELIRNHCSWEDTMKTLKKNIELCKKGQRRFEIEEQLYDMEHTNEIDEKRIECYLEWKEVSDKCLYWRAQKALIDLELVTAAIVDYEEKLTSLKMELGHAQAVYHEYVRIEELFNIQSQYLKDLKEKEGRLQQLETWFNGTNEEDGYKKWLYKTQITPVLTREVNKCIRSIESLRLIVSYENGGFVYMVEDGARKPTLDKASGYQNFIISLCMRITLARIGAMSHNIRQFIIDEGFTSCDADNLARMPHFLECLLKNKDFDSILLMSHLDGIRECASVYVDILADDTFSNIRYGKEYPLFNLINTKVRGRPSK